MTEPLLHLDTDAVAAHANQVDGFADRLSEIAAAAFLLDQQDEVYGEFPSKLILPILNLAQDDATHEFRAGSDATSQLADVLRAITVDLSITDQEAAWVLGFQEEGR